MEEAPDVGLAVKQKLLEFKEDNGHRKHSIQVTALQSIPRCPWRDKKKRLQC